MPPYTTEPTESEGRRQVGTTVAFVLLALLVTYLPPGPQQRIGAALRATVLRPFLSTQESLAAARVRALEAETLRAQLDSLVSVVTSTTTLAAENRQLRGLLSLSRRTGAEYVAASVIRPGTPGSESMFLLDVGTDDGVEDNAPIISRQGLVGLVREAGPASSIGMDWTHPDFRASAMSMDGSVYGFVRGQPGEFREEDQLILDGTPFHSRLEPGAEVVTSGLGDFPRGIPLGRVRELAEADAGWRKSYWLEPLVEPGSVTHVLVAVGAPGSWTDDLSDVWPPDSVLSSREYLELEEAKADSLRTLADSVRVLRELLAARDSAAAADTAGSGGGG